MKALVFAAGLGTRLRPLTNDRPKALVKICGRTLLEITLDNLVHQGFTDIVINVHHFGSLVEEFVGEYLQRCGGVKPKIVFSEEFDLLRDTGGGILHAKDLLCDGEPFLVHNVDIVSNLNLRALYGFASALEESDTRQIATVVVNGRYSDRRLLFDENMVLAGWENLKTCEVKSPREELASLSGRRDAHEQLMDRGLNPFAFAGVHVISPRVFDLLERYSSEHGEKFSVIDFYLNYSKDYTISGKFFKDLKIMDVGKIEHIAEAEALMGDLNL